MRRIIGCLCAVVVALSLPMARPASATSFLSVKFVNVGQGDAAIYEGPCGEIGIIDIPDGQAGTVADQIEPFPNAAVKWVAVSHYDDDHIGGIDDFLALQDVDAVYDRGGDRNVYDSNAYRSYYDVVTSEPGVRQPVDIGDTFTLCSGADQVTFSVISVGTDGTAVGGVAVSDENDRSVCLKVTHAAFDVATCGDINGFDGSGRSDVETPASAAIGNVEFAKVNHHGSDHSSNQTWVDTLDPIAVVIPVGQSNSYGHPADAVVQRWSDSGARVTQTRFGHVFVSYARDQTTFTVIEDDAIGEHPIDGTQPPTTPVPAARSIAPACTFDGGFEDGFDDFPSSNTHETAIDCAVYWQVTSGIRPGTYDPSNHVTRGQMASFLARVVEQSGGTLPTSPPDAFPDDNGTTHEASINKLAAVGITGGHADGTYGPNGPVARSQMATFIIRTLEYRLDGPVNDGQSAPDYFTDDDGDTHESNINKAAATGITGGTGGTDYSPQLRVRRDQMASFLARGLAELVDADAASIPAPPPKCSLDPAYERTDSRCQPCPYNSSITAGDGDCNPPESPSDGCSTNGYKYETANHVCIDEYDVDGNGDINCSELPSVARPVLVKDVGDDPYGLDADSDGVGCES